MAKALARPPDPSTVRVWAWQTILKPSGRHWQNVATDPPTASVTLEPPWQEANFERGRYGPDDLPGLEARFEQESMTVMVASVRYRCDGGRERIRGLTTDFDRSRREQTAVLPDVSHRTAFAVRAAYQPYATTETAVVAVAADADDALAIALWIANFATTDRSLQRTVHTHQGQQPAAAGGQVSDDDALGVAFADEPDRCLFTGRPTSSHQLRVPYRYLAVLDERPTSGNGRLRFPSTVETLVASVSHTAWEDRRLGTVDLQQPMAREGPGEYALDPGAIDALQGGDASACVLRRLGDG